MPPGRVEQPQQEDGRPLWSLCGGALEGSLQRLGLDYIDLFQFHRYDPNAPVEESVRAYGKHVPLKSMVMFGGVGMGPQEHALRSGVDVLPV